jgi:hypothetical protein
VLKHTDLKALQIDDFMDVKTTQLLYSTRMI